MRGTAYLVRLSVSPTEEDWNEGGEERGSRVWGGDQAAIPIDAQIRAGRIRRFARTSRKKT